MKKIVSRRKAIEHQDIDHDFIVHLFALFVVAFLAILGAYVFSQSQLEMRIPANQAYRLSVNE